MLKQAWSSLFADGHQSDRQQPVGLNKILQMWKVLNSTDASALALHVSSSLGLV
jgi:hypothetical protein